MPSLLEDIISGFGGAGADQGDGEVGSAILVAVDGEQRVATAAAGRDLRGADTIGAEVDHVGPGDEVSDRVVARRPSEDEPVAAGAADQIVVAAVAVQDISAGIAVEALRQRIAGEVDRRGSLGRRQSLDALARAEREALRCHRQVVAFARGLGDEVAAIDIIKVVADAASEMVVAGAAVQKVVAAEADQIVVAAAAIQVVDPGAAVQALAELVAAKVNLGGRVLVDRDQRLDLIALAQRVARGDEDPVVAAANLLADIIRGIDIIAVVAEAAQHVVRTAHAGQDVVAAITIERL